MSDALQVGRDDFPRTNVLAVDEWNPPVIVEIVRRVNHDPNCDLGTDVTEPSDFPMRRYVADPLGAGVLHRDGWVEALGDGVADEGGAFLLEQVDQPSLLRNQPINPLRLPIQKAGDGGLRPRRRERKQKIPHI